MKPGGSKRKGAQFERYVCKRLSEWVSNGTRDDLFWRSAMSGGRATVGLKAGIARAAQTGDVTALSGKGKFVKKAGWLTANYTIECKAVKSLEMSRLALRRDGFLRKVWQKSNPLYFNYGDEWVNMGDIPALLIVARQNGGDEIVLFGMDTVPFACRRDRTKPATSLVILRFIDPDNHIHLIGVMSFDEFLQFAHLTKDRITLKCF